MAVKKRQKNEKETLVSEKDSVKKRDGSVSKSVSKKDGVSKKSGMSVLKMIFYIWVLIKVVIGLYMVYKIYVQLVSVPDMPKLNVDEWWTSRDRNTQDTSIRRFKAMFTDAIQEQLRKKIELYKSQLIRMKSFNETWQYGTNSVAFGQVFAHWQYNYVYRERARFLNKYEHFKTNIQGLDIHYVHVKPKIDKTNVKLRGITSRPTIWTASSTFNLILPLLLLHGWPSTFRDFYEMIPLLTTPADGFDFVFEVIVPSLPGFVYSEAPTKPGMGPLQIAIVMANLMDRLGFQKYYVHGGDYGHIIGSHMATYFDNRILGFHTSFPVNFSALSILTWVLGSICPALVGQGYENRMYPLRDKVEYLLEESGYLHLQSTKPDTVGIALSDSPAGLLSYLIDRYVIFTNPDSKNTEDGGLLTHFNMTELVDNVMLFWATNSITTSMRIYKESFQNSRLEKTMAKIPTRVPTWGLRTKHQLLHQPDFILRWKYPNLVGTTSLDFGGHFSALEIPEAVASDLFLSVKSFESLKKET